MCVLRCAHSLYVLTQSGAHKARHSRADADYPACSQFSPIFAIILPLEKVIAFVIARGPSASLHPKASRDLLTNVHEDFVCFKCLPLRDYPRVLIDESLFDLCLSLTRRSLLFSQVAERASAPIAQRVLVVFS